jgi:hypothetical protein
MTLPSIYTVRSPDGTVYATDAILDEALKRCADRINGTIYNANGTVVYKSPPTE